MLTTLWPLRHLRLTTERLVLRLPTEHELADLADVAAAGIHEPGERPFLTPWTELEPAKRAQWVMQAHWSSLGSWSPDDWGLDLAVFRDGVPIGVVTLAAKQFAVLREVRSSSWFGLAHHGQGYGTEARTALLHLAFAELGAEAATSEVFQDNHSSQAVSRKLGYQPDGISRDVLHGEAVISDRLRLTRADWRPRAVQVEGLEQCRSFFGAE